MADKMSWRSRMSLALADLRQKDFLDMPSMLNGDSFPGNTYQRSRRGVPEVLRAYSNSPWLRAVASRVMTSIDATEWTLVAGKRGKKIVRDFALQRAGAANRKELLKARKAADELEPITDHPALAMLYGNTTGTLSALALAGLYVDLVGEGFWIKERDDNGMFIRPWCVPPTWMKRTPTTKDPTFEVAAGSFRGVLPREDVVWFKSVDPSDPYGRGSGLGTTLGDELDTDEAAAGFVKSWFTQGAIPPVIISGMGNQKDAGADTRRLETKWMQKTQGFLRRHRPFFMSRNVKVTQLAHTFEQMQVIDLRRFERDITIQTWGVSPEALGIIENSNRATIDAADYLYSKLVLLPRLEFFRRTLQAVIEEEYDNRLVLLYGDVVAEDKDHNLKVATAAPWSLLVDEWREMGGREAMPGDQGQVVVVPLSADVVPLANLGDPNWPVALSASAPGTKLVAPDPTTALPPGAKTKAAPIVSGEPILDALAEMVPALRAKVAAAFEKLTAAVDVAALEAALTTGNLEAAAALVDPVALGSDFSAALAILEDALGVAGGMAATDLAEAIGASLTFDLTNPVSVEYIATHGAELVTGLDSVTGEGVRQAIKDILAQGYAEGVTPAKQAKAIAELIGIDSKQARALQGLREAMLANGVAAADVEIAVAKRAKKMIKYRAQRIARHELNTASGQGQRQLWGQAVDSGLLTPSKTRRVWITTPDDRLCLLCSPMDGEQAPLDGPWEGGYDTPQDIHIMCRCSQGLVFI